MAVGAVGLSRAVHYQWLHDDPVYAAAFEQSREQAADRLEQEARRRAIEGVRRKKFTRAGEPIMDTETGKQYEELEYSDTLLIFLLKGARPDTYRERQVHELTGKDGGPIESMAVIEVRPIDYRAAILPLAPPDDGARSDASKSE